MPGPPTPQCENRNPHFPQQTHGTQVLGFPYSPFAILLSVFGTARVLLAPKYYDEYSPWGRLPAGPSRTTARQESWKNLWFGTSSVRPSPGCGHAVALDRLVVDASEQPLHLVALRPRGRHRFRFRHVQSH